MNTRFLMVGASLMLASLMPVQAQSLPRVAEYSGSFRLAEELRLQDGILEDFKGSLTIATSAGKSKICSMTGMLWAEPLRMERYEYGPRVLIVVPDSVRIACPGEPIKAVLGIFAGLPSDRGWNPQQSTICVKDSKKDFFKCLIKGVSVKKEQSVEWTTWHAFPMNSGLGVKSVPQ